MATPPCQFLALQAFNALRDIFVLRPHDIEKILVCFRGLGPGSVIAFYATSIFRT